MADYSTDILRGPAKNQMIQALNDFYNGDMDGYYKCLQILEDTQQEVEDQNQQLFGKDVLLQETTQQLEEQREFKRNYRQANKQLQKKMEDKDAIHKRSIHRLEVALKSVVVANFEYERTNSALQKTAKGFNKLATDGKKVFGDLENELGNLSFEVARKAEKAIAARKFIDKSLEEMPKMAKRFSELALELEKCRTQCVKKDTECDVGVAALEEIDRITSNFRSISNSLVPHSNLVNSFLLNEELDNEAAKPAEAEEQKKEEYKFNFGSEMKPDECC